MKKPFGAAGAAFSVVLGAALLCPVEPATPAARPALPQTCGEHEQIARLLSGSYGEYLVASGRLLAGVVELWVSDAQTWTLLRILPGGIACLVMAGRDIRFSRPRTGKEREA